LDEKVWPALLIRAVNEPTSVGLPPDDDLVAATLDDFAPVAIQDLTELPVPPGVLWDPTFPSPTDPPPAPLQWRAFFATSTNRDAAAAAIAAAYPALSVSREDVADEDWAARSQRALTAVVAGHFMVAPPWDIPQQAAGGLTTIVIEPSRGFGTGHHASTRLCLRALSATDVRDRAVLDLGTGSGVLAIAAALSGARTVTAVDIDPDAMDAARQSAALNRGVERIEWLVGDFRDADWTALARDWDFVLANLTGGMLIASAKRLGELVGSKGALVASGFDVSERARVEKALDLTVRSALIEEGWVGLVASR
jgi:ribosomal protein L11 methyltransferase